MFKLFGGINRKFQILKLINYYSISGDIKQKKYLIAYGGTGGTYYYHLKIPIFTSPLSVKAPKSMFLVRVREM